jgi:hypothetical protein
MKRYIKLFGIFLINVTFVTGCGKGPRFEIKNLDENSKELRNELLISKGEHLARIAGCEDCHSPKQVTSRGILEI